MINDLDQTLKALLEHDLSPGLVSPDNISFAAPDDTFSTSVGHPAIDLFLYDLRENRERRDCEWRIERSAARVLKHPPPVQVDCSYLITAWVGENDDPTDEHRLLGEVMRVLLGHRTLPDHMLQGRLCDQEAPLRAWVTRADHMWSGGEFWRAIGGRPRAAFHYTVTLGVDVGKPVDLGPPVTRARVAGKG